MRGVVGSSPQFDGRVTWTIYGENPFDTVEGFGIIVRTGHSARLTQRDALNFVRKILDRSESEEGWLTFSRPNWFFDVARYREKLPGDLKGHIDDLEWLKGHVLVTPEVEYSTDRSGRRSATVHFRILKEEFLLDHTTKIFLSHKGADKPKVRRFSSVLKELGYNPWLDEDAMAAGAELHRDILQGFKDSCAAVFFITPNFRDEAYLRSEVNYAVQQKNDKAVRFAIITLVFDGATKEHVPDLLRGYVWKEPHDDLAALTEILRALPITLGLPSWRPGL